MSGEIDKDEMKKRLDEFRFSGKAIPGYMHEGMIRYFCEGRLPGDFLTAILSNDCRTALNHADDVNMWLLPVYHAFLYNCAPVASWGSKNNIRHWIAPFAKARLDANGISDEKELFWTPWRSGSPTVTIDDDIYF